MNWNQREAAIPDAHQWRVPRLLRPSSEKCLKLWSIHSGTSDDTCHCKVCCPLFVQTSWDLTESTMLDFSICTVQSGVPNDNLLTHFAKKNTFVKVFTVRLTASNVCKYMYINSNFDISNVNSLILWPWYTRCTSDHHLGLLADVAPGSSKSDVGKAVEIPTRGTTESSQTNEEKTDPCTIHNFQQS